MQKSNEFEKIPNRPPDCFNNLLSTALSGYFLITEMLSSEIRAIFFFFSQLSSALDAEAELCLRTN